MIFNAIIPLPYYSDFFFDISFMLCVFAFFTLLVKGNILKNEKSRELSSGVLMVLVTAYMGFRPISYWFGDMGTYARTYWRYAAGDPINGGKDFFWELFMKTCSSLITAESFFLLCAILYIVPLFAACKKWFGANTYIPFLMFVASFSFWPYGTNGIRNGIATSIFVFALSRDRTSIKMLFIVLAYLAHASILIPMAAFMLSVFHKNSKHYLLGWLVAIPLSLAMGGFWESFFMSLGYGGDRVDYLTDDTYADSFSATGFRWDFVFYSAAAVFAGYYYIIKKKFEDRVYHQIFNIYVTANAFWILIIRASFSNRFAYLSWFLMAAVIFYPLFKEKLLANQAKKVAFIVFGYALFSFVMNRIIY